jgi:hypothetical protein
MITFDGTAREVCSARRIRTNTPLQSLTTLNDSAYIETAKHFAYRMQAVGRELRQQISKGYELAMYKPITPKDFRCLRALYNNALKKYKADPKNAVRWQAVITGYRMHPLRHWWWLRVR